MTRTDARRWPLRAGLSVCLLGLVALNVDVTHLPHATPVTSAPTTSAPVTSTTGVADSSVPTTTAPSSSPNAVHPLTSPAVLTPPRRGCGFSMVTTSSTATSTSTSSTTTSLADSSGSTSSTLASSTTAPTSAHRAAPRALGRCVVLEIGDSLGNDLGWGLARELHATPGLTLVQLDKSSSGLANGWFFDWPSHLRAALAQYRPNLVIVCLGGNDEQAMKINGRSTAFATPAWIHTYTAMVHQIVAASTAAGSFVLWVGMPIMGPAGYRQGMTVLNSVYAKVAGRTPGSAFLPTWSLFADARGQFAATGRVGGTVTVLRSPDGIHFSYVGEQIIATFVARALAAIYHVHVVPDAPMIITR